MIRRVAASGAVAGAVFAYFNPPLWALAATAAFVIGCVIVFVAAEVKS